MAGNRQITKLEDRAFDVLIKQGIFSIEVPASVDPQNVSSVIEQKMHERLKPVFLQAIVDDDRMKVMELLDEFPNLLLLKATKGLVIESQHTWLKIDAENESALSIAAKRKQIEMIEIMLPYYEKLEQTEKVIKAKTDALSAWKDYDMQKKANDEDEIIIPQEYAIYAQSLIDIFKDETFPNGVKGKFSQKAQNALESLFNILLPKKAVKLDDYLDSELFLFTLYKTYSDKFETFQNKNQRDAFCIRVIGLAQSVLSPEAAKIFCEGFSRPENAMKKISLEAESLKLLEDKSFYRASRDSLAGTGFDHFVVGLRKGAQSETTTNDTIVAWARLCRWRSYVKQKQLHHGALRSCSNQTDTQQVIYSRTM